MSHFADIDGRAHNIFRVLAKGIPTNTRRARERCWVTKKRKMRAGL